jgi:choice-of-anchor A domain-containing protein
LSVPADFNLVTLGDISDFPSIEGPVFAGGNLRTSSFGINQTVRDRVGAAVFGDVALTNGELIGDLHAGGSLSLIGVGRDGELLGSPGVNRDRLGRAAIGTSTALAAEISNGIVEVTAWGTTMLVGTEDTFNAFDVTAATLAETNTLELHAPAASAVVINVSGDTVTFGNAGVNLQGPTSSDVLWNMPTALMVSLSSVGLPGSILAPQAKLMLSNGHVDGTALVGSAQGNGAFRSAPFSHWEALPGVVTDPDEEVIAQRVELSDGTARLFAGCTYTITIADDVPLTQAGACLGEPFSVSFRVADGEGDALQREAKHLDVDEEGTVRSFVIDSGINMRPDVMLER